MDENSNKKPIKNRDSYKSNKSIKHQSQDKDVIVQFEIEEPKSKLETNSRNSVKSKDKENPALKKNAQHPEDPISSNFAKYENLAKQKFLESLSSKNMKKKSTITNVIYNNQSSAALNIETVGNDNRHNATEDALKTNNHAVELINKNDFVEAKSQLERKDSVKPIESNFRYKKLNQVHSEYNQQEETSQWEKAWNWVREKGVQLYENENLRTCLNPFRNDPDPCARYCYYCMTATCCLIWFIIFYMAMSTC